MWKVVAGCSEQTSDRLRRRSGSTREKCLADVGLHGGQHQQRMDSWLHTLDGRKVDCIASLAESAAQVRILVLELSILLLSRSDQFLVQFLGGTEVANAFL